MEITADDYCDAVRDAAKGLYACAEAKRADTTVSSLQYEREYLHIFSRKIVDLLVAEAIRALRAPDHAGMDFAVCMLLDAQRYDTLSPFARPLSDVDLHQAAEKLGKRYALYDSNG